MDAMKMRSKVQPILILFSAFLLASSLFGQAIATKDVPVTPVQGESWLNHLHRPFNESSMGRTWQLGPPPPAPGQKLPDWQLNLSPAFDTSAVVLHGSDLYRLNCQGCHQESGLGAPPEINSIVDPVRATSAATIAARMKAAGREADHAMVSELAKQSYVLLMQRLHEGGKEMPPPNLTEPEIRAVFAYLEQLSGVLGAEKKQIELKESRFRIGEHIVKSTCHTCHGATGPNPTPQQILEGAIPPLGSLPTRVSLPEFVRKVTAGAPILMGAQPSSYRDYYRGRMPVFAYLTEDEAAAAFLYLEMYPPRQ
jgi:mono/diheme cytochrome c family protein